MVEMNGTGLVSGQVRLADEVTLRDVVLGMEVASCSDLTIAD